MSFKDCIARAVAAGRVKAERADEALSKYEELKKMHIDNGIDAAEAERLASNTATDIIDREAIRKKVQAAASLKVTQRILADFHQSKDWGQAALDLWEHGSTNYVSRKNTISGYAQGLFYQALDKYAPKMSGLIHPTDGLDNLLKEIWGIKTGDTAAAEMAKAWKATSDFLYNRAKVAGADIGKLDDWHLPNSHDAARIIKDSGAEYAKFTDGLLDWEAMERSMGDDLFTPERRIAMLKEIRETLVQDGANKIIPSMQRTGSGSLANRMGAHRFLVFKDADAWLAYHARYGVGSVFDVMTGHMEKMSHEIAMLEVFGPNPAATKEWLKSTLKQQASGLDRNATNKANLIKADKAGIMLDRIYNTVTGANHILRDSAAAQVLAATRDTLTAAMLGSASINAITGDLITKAHWRVMERLPAAKTGLSYLKLLTGLDAEESRALAVRSGFLFDSAVQHNASAVRYFGQVTGPQITRRISDTVMRLSAMSRHTEAIRWSMMSEFTALLADQAGKNFDELEPGLMNIFKRHKITPTEWDKLRALPVTEQGPVKMLVPNDLRQSADPVAAATADKFMDMIFTERDNAIAATSLKARATLIGESQSGTLAGEMLNSLAMFKNFPVTIMQLHLRRMLEMPSVGGKIAYGTAFLAGTTLMGALSYQLRQIAAGKDPVPMFGDKGWNFWGQAFLQGGGMGILGDFLFRDTNRFGGGLTQTLSGPVVSFGADTLKLTIGNAMDAAQGKKMNLASDLVNYTRRYMPGSNIWWARAALQHGVFDQLLIQADPHAYQKFNRQRAEARREYGQGFWWEPGKALPNRAPDLLNAVH